MTRALRPSDFAKAVPAADDLALLARLLRHAGHFPEMRLAAQNLLAQFGSLPAVIFADPERLERAVGLTPRVVSEIALIRTLHEDLARRRLEQRAVIGSHSALVDYCRLTLGHLRNEAFHVLYLDRKNHLIRAEELARGSIDHVTVYPRLVVSRALELDASAMVLAHNHPSGDASPSTDDERMTERLAEAAALFDITVHDHVIIGRTGEFSFRSAGLL